MNSGTITVRGLRYAVALGVAIGVAMGAFRIVTGTPLHWYIIAAYVVVIIQTAFAPRPIIPLAYDSGGVTTSTVTVPLVAALGLALTTADAQTRGKQGKPVTKTDTYFKIETSGIGG